MAPASEAIARPRRRYIDWARGLAVLIMVEAHTVDSWTRTSSRGGFTFGRLSILGGFAAPLFLWLAGLSLVLAAEGTLERSSSRRAATAAIVRRGAEIFILAFLFRLQAFVVSPGSSPVTIFRVDILNVMGVSIGVAGLLWGLSRNSQVAAVTSAVAAVLIAMATPLVTQATWVNGLPLWVQWHLRPFGDQTTFTLFPWAGFVFAGAAVGALLAVSRDRGAERRLLVALGLTGAAVTWLGFYFASQPSLYASSSFWTTSPTFFAIRAGVILIALALLFVAGEFGVWAPPGLGVLEVFGRNSLFIYWIHVEMVYGYLTWVIRHRLPLWGTAIALIVFIGLLYRAIGFRDRVVASWRARAAGKAAARAVPA